MNPQIEAALQVAGLELSVEGFGQLEALAEWLREEAIPAGGLGPGEGALVETRHISDAILYAVPFATAPAECWDLGSGIGLPGLVLAVVWPETAMVLIDRSGKRCDLARRAARIIGAEIEVWQADWASVQGSVGAIVSRAAAPASALLPTVRRLLKPGGTAVVSGSGNAVPGYEPLELRGQFFDRAPRLLIMRAT